MSRENIDWDCYADPPHTEHDITYKENLVYVNGILTYIITDEDEKIDVSFSREEQTELEELLKTEPVNSKNNKEHI